MFYTLIFRMLQTAKTAVTVNQTNNSPVTAGDLQADEKCGGNVEKEQFLVAPLSLQTGIC